MKDKNEVTASLSIHKRGGKFQIKNNYVLTAKQAEFVNKELSASNCTILIKKFMTPNIPEETELDNPYQKTLTTGHENKIEQSDQKKNPAQMKEYPYGVTILSISPLMGLKPSTT